MRTGTALGADDLSVSHARVAGWRSGRHELLRELERVPVASLALSADEILYVPRLHLRGVEGARLANAAFESLREMVAVAERDPARATPSGAALRFSSRARYLAWLVGLWMGGSSSEAAAIAATGVTSLRAWQRRELLNDGRALVAVVVHLAQTRLAARWIARFEPIDHALAEASLARDVGLDLRASEAQPAGSQADAADARHVATAGDRRIPLRVAGARMSAAEVEVATLAGELGAGRNDWQRLQPRGRRLLLAAVALARAPARASRRSFVAAIHAVAARASVTGDEHNPIDEPPRSSSARPTIDGGKARTAMLRQEKATPSDPHHDLDYLPSSAPEGAESNVDFEEIFERTANAPAKQASLDGKRDAIPIEPLAPIVFRSRFAGLLFLLNAFVALDLYPDFASARTPKLDPSPLWLIDRVAQFWFGAPYRRDPLHRWIAGHSRGGELPRNWKVEDGWALAWRGRKRHFLTEYDGYATLWHAAGFPIEDVPVARERSLRRTRQLRNSGRTWRLPRLPTERRLRWIACFAHFLDARILAATGDRSVGLAALAQAGDVTIDELDVTVRFTFELQTVPLRLAGLDRDPAWQPAEGRYFRFHFS